MIEISVSYGFGEDNRYHDPNIPQKIQLALYKYDLYKQYKKDIFKLISRNHTHVNVVHMPLDFLRHSSSLMFNMIKELRDEVGAFKFIVHPNKNIKQFLVDFMEEDIWDVMLCIENFPWRSRKELRTPLQIIEFINVLQKSSILTGLHPELFSMCLDTSHTDDIWFDHKILLHLLPYTSVIHLSNRKGKKQHLPFNINKGDLNLVSFIKKLKRMYNWDGDIVLEYMPEYRHKLYRNAEYIKRLLK